MAVADDQVGRCEFLEGSERFLRQRHGGRRMANTPKRRASLDKEIQFGELRRRTLSEGEA